MATLTRLACCILLCVRCGQRSLSPASGYCLFTSPFATSAVWLHTSRGTHCVWWRMKGTTAWWLVRLVAIVAVVAIVVKCFDLVALVVIQAGSVSNNVSPR